MNPKALAQTAIAVLIVLAAVHYVAPAGIKKHLGVA